MNGDVLFFFGQHMDALPMYEKLEEQISFPGALVNLSYLLTPE